MINISSKNRRYSILTKSRSLFTNLVSSNIRDKDVARRAFVLNVLLLGSFLLSFIATCVSWAFSFQENDLFRSESIQNTLITIMFLVGYVLSQAGKSRLISYFFVLFYLLINLDASYRWGAALPQTVLTYSLIVVMSGILINSKFAFIVTTVISFFLITLTHIQSTSIFANQNVSIRDGIVFSITLYIIATVSWLFNREGEAALKRARYSERALQKERDSLAVKVEEKTKELRQEQADKVAQLYRFAEFGKLTSGFLHDLSNSVNLVSSNLRQLENTKSDLKGMKQIISRAKVGTKRLESFILATRKQINNQDFLEDFSVNDEIEQAIEILNYKAKKSNVIINFHPDVTLQTYGNPMKFHQLMCNLLSNGIDAYDASQKKNKTLEVLLSGKDRMIKIQVIDYGKGISKNHIKQIFLPFFTTKEFNKGTGIGLSISHDIVTQNFKGEIFVESTPRVGSTFTVVFPQAAKI